MKQIVSLSDDPKQKLNFVLETGEKIVLDFVFVNSQKGWFLSIEYGSFVIRNRRIVTSPNMIRAFRNILPFGIACITTDKQEPIYKDDFLSGRATLYVLNETDVEYVENTVIPEYRD